MDKLFVIDTIGHASDADSATEACNAPRNEPAWIDPDDSNPSPYPTSNNGTSGPPKREQVQRQAINRCTEELPVWARQNNNPQTTSSDASVVSVLDVFSEASTRNLGRRFFPTVRRAQDLPVSEDNKHTSIITTEFHPSVSVLMAASHDRRIRLFQIDGKSNPQIQSLSIDDLPMRAAHFDREGSEIVAIGKKPYIYVLNMQRALVKKLNLDRGKEGRSWKNVAFSPCGTLIALLSSAGSIELLSAKTKRWIGTLKTNGAINSITFSFTSQYLYAIGVEHLIYTWDLKMFRCIDTMQTDGGNSGTCLASSVGDDPILACGFDSGVVDLYQHGKSEQKLSTKLCKVASIDNLNTPIDMIKIDPHSRLMCFSSRDKKSALRMASLPTGRVLPDWPTSKTPIGYTTTFDFDATGSRLAIGNSKGKLLLYSLSYSGM